MKFTDVMIDIETLGNNSHSPIIQIGACAFNLRTGEIGTRFQTLVKPVLSTPGSVGAVADLPTFLWWLEQGEEARAAVRRAGVDGRREGEAIGALSAYIIDNAQMDVCVWAMPPEFDLVILRNTADRAGVTVPWHYAATRDLRTLEYLAGGSKDQREKPEIAHDAGSDAVAQAKTAVAYYRKWMQMRQEA